MTRRYRLLLRLLPKSRRQKDGADMAAVFDQLRQSAWRERGWPGICRLWIREIAGMARFAWRERRRAAPPRRSISFASLHSSLALAFRMLRREKGPAIASIVAIGLGVATSTAVFSVIDRVVLRPLTAARPDRLVDLWESRKDGLLPHGTLSGLEVTAWAARATSLEAFAAHRYAPLTLTGDGPAVRIIGMETTPAFFDVLGVTMIAGRGFTPDEIGSSAAVVVIGEPLWRSHFGGDPQAVGRRMDLDGQSRVVVGVLPAAAAYPAVAEAWIPFRVDPARMPPGQHSLSAIARLRDDRTIADARAELSAIAAALEHEQPDTNVGHGAGVDPLIDAIVGPVRPALRILLVTALLVLLIATANVSGLLLARSVSRQREFALRRALGAGAGALAVQLLAEGLVLAVAGALVGLATGAAATRSLLGAVSVIVPQAVGARLNARVALFAFAMAVLAGCGAQLVPIARAVRGRFDGLGLRQATADRGSLSTRRAVVALQVALAFALLTGSLLLVRSLAALSHVDPGFTAAGDVTFNMQLSPLRYADPDRQVAFVGRALEALRQIPGVTAAGVVTDLPFSGSRSTTSFQAAGLEPRAGETLAADLRVATPGYFAALGLPIASGRAFSDADDRHAEPIAVINRTLASRLWPGEPALGRRLLVGGPDEIAVYGQPVWRAVVGVTGDILHDDLRGRPRPEIYVPYAQAPSRRLAFAVRTAGAIDLTADVIRARLREVEPHDAIFSVRTMTDRLSRAVAGSRLLALLTSLFATLAVVLAAFGLHAALAYAVRQRTTEFGIRLALGAGAGDIARIVAAETARVIVAGLAVGGAGGYLLVRWLSTSLFGVGPADPLTIGVSVVVVVAIGLAAAALPTRRALSAEPSRLFRES